MKRIHEATKQAIFTDCNLSQKKFNECIDFIEQIKSGKNINSRAFQSMHEISLDDTFSFLMTLKREEILKIEYSAFCENCEESNLQKYKRLDALMNDNHICDNCSRDIPVNLEDSSVMIYFIKA